MKDKINTNRTLRPDKLSGNSAKLTQFKSKRVKQAFQNILSYYFMKLEIYFHRSTPVHLGNLYFSKGERMYSNASQYLLN